MGRCCGVVQLAFVNFSPPSLCPFHLSVSVSASLPGLAKLGNPSAQPRPPLSSNSSGSHSNSNISSFPTTLFLPPSAASPRAGGRVGGSRRAPDDILGIFLLLFFLESIDRTRARVSCRTLAENKTSGWDGGLAEFTPEPLKKKKKYKTGSRT